MQVLARQGPYSSFNRVPVGNLWTLKSETDYTVRESANKSAANAASPDYVKFQAVIKSAASAASPTA